MTSRSPASVPTEEEVSAAIGAGGRPAVERVRALFAPILAEKEREIATFDSREAEWNEAIANSLQNEEDAHRKLEAAEAALAAVEGKIAKALPEIVPAVEDWLFNGASDQDTAKAIATAIRAQGE